MFCVSCGTKLDDDAKFCTVCGASATNEETAKEEEKKLPKIKLEKPAPEIKITEEEVNEENILYSPDTDNENDFSEKNYSPYSNAENQDTNELDRVIDESLDARLYEPEKINNYPNNPYNDNLDTQHIRIPEEYLEQDNTPQPQFEPPADDFPEYVGNNVPEAPAERSEEQETRVGGLRIFGAFVVSIFALVFMLAFSLAFCVKLGISGDILKSRTEKLNIDNVLTAKYGETDVSSNMYNTLDFGNLTGGASNETNFRSFISNTDLLEFTGENVKNYVDYILDGKGSDPSVTAEDISGFFRKNAEQASDTFGYRLVTNDFNRIESRLENQNVISDLSVSQWESKLGFRVKLFSFIFSYITLGIILALVLVLLIWIAIIVDKRGKYLTGFYGNIFCISGLLMLVISLVILVGSSIAYSFTSHIAFYLSSNLLMPFSLFAVCTGVFELVIGIIFKLIRKFIKKREVKNA